MEEMNELFYHFPYQKEFTSKVRSCVKMQNEYAIELEDTLFYPEGGGQPCDIGTLDQAEVVDVQRIDGQIVHFCTQPLQEGSEVKGVIDWDRRFDFMQQHSGEHIVSGLIHEAFGYENVDFHMGDVIQIDIDGPMSEEQAEDIFTKANEMVYQNVPIAISFPTAEELAAIPYRSKKELTGKVRIVTIPGADICACCGTHVARTGEIGLITMLSIKKHKKGVRIEMVCGKRAYAHLKRIQKENDTISHLLSAEVNQTSTSVSELLARYQSTIAELRNVQYAQVEEQMKQLEPSAVTLLFTQHLDRKQMITASNTLLQNKMGKVVGICNKEEQGYSYVLMSEEIPLKKYAQIWNQELQGRGGGKDDMVQGTFQSTKEEIEKQIKGALHEETI